MHRGGSPATWWRAVFGSPHEQLRGVVDSYAEYEEFSMSPVSRRELPSPASVLIIELAEPLLAIGAAEHGDGRWATAFLGSPGRGPAMTWHDGFQHCVEIRLTLLGTYRLFGSMRDLGGRIVALDALWGRNGECLVARLAEAETFQLRFDLLDQVLRRVFATGQEPEPEVVHAWTRLSETAGAVAIGELLGETGWSRGRLAERFRAQCGLTPKAAASLLRFHRAVDLIDRGTVPLPSVAQTCGYYDQAHLNRDFRAHAGCTPTEWTNSQLTDLVGAGPAA